MNTVPRNWVWAAAVVLALTALGSLVLGATRGGPGRDAVSDIGQLAPVPDAAQAKPIADLTAEDARFRQIAREEAQAAVARTTAPRPKAAAPKAEDDGGDDNSPSTSTNDSVAAPVVHTPAAMTAKPLAAVTPASVAGQRALLGPSARSATNSGARSSPGASNPASPD